MTTVQLALLLAAGVCVAWLPAPRIRLRALARRAGTGRFSGRILPAVLGVTAVVAVVVRAGQTTTALAGAVAVAAAVAGWRTWRTRRARERREEATAVFLGLLAGQLEAGAPASRAVEAAARGAREKDPAHVAALALALSGGAAGTAGGWAQGTDGEADRDTAQLAGLWHAAQDHGLPTAALVEQARARVEQRRRHRESTAAALTGPQSTAVILALLPLAGIGLGTAMGANPLAVLTGGGTGGMLLVAGIALIAAGLSWSRVIITRASGVAR